MSADIFISFASKDLKIAQTITSALESRGFTCWISSRDIEPGDDFQESIYNAISVAKAMLFIFSGNSNNSDEVKKEIALAGQHKLFVIPVRVEDVTPNPAFAYEFATRQWIDFFEDWERGMDHLSAQIARILGSPAPDPLQSRPAPPPAAPAPVARPAAATTAAPARRGLRPWAYGLIGAGVLAVVLVVAIMSSSPDKPASPAAAPAGGANAAKGGDPWAHCTDPNDAATAANSTVAGCTAIIEAADTSKEDRTTAYTRRGDIQFHANRFERAINNYNQALALVEDPVVLGNRANAYDARGGPGDHDLAIADWTRAISIDPKDAQGYFDRGTSKQSHGDDAGGAADIATAKRLDPSFK